MADTLAPPSRHLLQRGLAAAVCTALLAPLAAMAQAIPVVQTGDFEIDLYKTRFEHEVAFRAAAIQVAWSAENLCDNLTEIEPFVLWSVHALKKSMSTRDLEYLRRGTGMDERWRVVWIDEGAPDELRLGDVAVAINDRPLPGGAARLDPGAWFKGGSVVASDDQAFWDVLLKAREQAAEGTLMTISLADGRTLKVQTQTGCAGSVVGSAFDASPDQFGLQGNERVKIPGNAMLAARTRDEFRWLAAFGTCFQASRAAISHARRAEDLGNAFVVGKVLTMMLPGAGMLLTAVEAQAERALVVDSSVGRADLFANEVVAAMGSDPYAGLALSEQLAAAGAKVDVVMMNEFRRSNAAEHARRLIAIEAAQAKARAEAELAERQAQEEARPAHRPPPPR
jgi:hypothetical protein